MSYASIAVQLEVILNTITELHEVFDHVPKQLTKFPCATISAISHTDSFTDLAANKRVYTFAVRCFVRTDNAADAERILRITVDKIITALESNVTLNGACDFASPTKGQFQFIERETPMLVCDITLEAKKRVSR